LGDLAVKATELLAGLALALQPALAAAPAATDTLALVEGSLKVADTLLGVEAVQPRRHPVTGILQRTLGLAGAVLGLCFLVLRGVELLLRDVEVVLRERHQRA